MASGTENLNGKLQEVNAFQLSNIERKENQKLRDAGLEYLSKTGRTVAAKSQPEQLCNCPQKCGERVPEDVKKYLFTEFYKMGDHIIQNHFLQKYIEVRSVRKRLWSADEQSPGGRMQRRVTCKYRIPLEVPEEAKNANAAMVVNKTPNKPVSNGLHASTKNSKERTVEVCQKAFMNVFAITEKRIRLQREKLILKSRKDAGMNISENQTPLPPTPTWVLELMAEVVPSILTKEILANISSIDINNLSSNDVPPKIQLAVDKDIAIVSNFFFNQLWSPEFVSYEKTNSNKKASLDLSKPISSSKFHK